MPGNPVRLLLTAGHRSGHTPAKALADGFHADFVIADKGYDSATFIETLKGSGDIPVIPPRSRRKIPGDCDKDICREQPGGTVVPEAETIPSRRCPL
jgi:putative transposase